jgi:hypothetical protein
MLIQPRRGTSDQWTSANPILAVGEMGYETDTKKFKYGDGLTNWLDLPYGISVSNLSDAGLVGIELLNSDTAEQARTILNIGTGVSVTTSGITDSTTVGRAVIKAATTDAALTAIGGTTVGKAVFTAANAAAGLTALGAGTYSKPSTGIPSTDLATAVQTALTAAGTALQAVNSTTISDATATGRSILTAASAAAVKTLIGAGSSDLALGTTSTTALAGNYAPASTSISDSTAVGRSVLTAPTTATARSAIGAGTSSLALGTTSSTAKAGDYQPTSANISDSTAIGRTILTAADAAAVRTAIGVSSSGTTTTIASTGISDATTVGKAVLTAADAATARTVLGAGIGSYSKPTNGIPSSDLAAAVQTALSQAGTALQTVTSTNLSDSTATGRSVITATDATAGRTALGAGTYTKPGSGIPITDLTTSLQTSLGKADTALQTVSSTTITDATTTGRALLTATSAANALSTLGAGSYSKPSTGIPLTDLATTIQTSLGKADTALQAVVSTTITDSTATGRSLLTATSPATALTALGAGTYSKPSGGIPATDLTTAVNTSLGLANTALQSVPSGYVQGSSNGTTVSLTLWTGTAAQYAAIATKSSTTVYIVTA